MIAGAVWLFKYRLRTRESFQFKVDAWTLRLIVVGPILKKGIIARFARTLFDNLGCGYANRRSLAINGTYHGQLAL